MKKRKQNQKRISGVPTDAKLTAEVTTVDGGKAQIYVGKDGAVYMTRMERVSYRLLGAQ